MNKEVKETNSYAQYHSIHSITKHISIRMKFGTNIDWSNFSVFDLNLASM